MCFSFWGVSRGDSRLTNQSTTWSVYLRSVSISPGKTPEAKTHSVPIYLFKKFFRQGSSQNFGNGKKKGPAPKLFKNEACRICGERAEGVNYNAISCMACKAFYRRVVVAGKDLVCIFPSQDHNMSPDEKRSRCRHCRLEACHAAGMKPQYVTLEKKPSLMNFSDTLNPQQENMLNICQSFWA
jgi:hypothetical protein